MNTTKPSSPVNVIPCHPSEPDYAAIKKRQQATWATGDYAVVGRTLQIVGEALCEAVDLRAGERVLDVAAGNGNATLAAARRFAEVTGSDYVPELLDKLRARAEAEGFAIELREADAERLPFADASFDVVLSTFGVMFTPDQERAARELVRVTRPGGRIALANWTPDGMIGQLFRTIGQHLPPPAGVKSPALWGSEARLAELFRGAREISVTRKEFVFRYLSAEHWLQVFRQYYGPVNKAFEALDTRGRAALTEDLMDLLAKHDRGGGRGLVAPSTYAEVVVRLA